MTFELFLFSTDPEFIQRTVAGGVRGVVVDWERIGKPERQASADTQINQDTVDDLRRVRAATTASVLCRVNNHSSVTPIEIEQALEAGADEILLPMVRLADEVELALDALRGRAGLGILVETVWALEHLDELARFPLTRVYVGLNDLAIDRGTSNLFAAVTDGTVERVRRRTSASFGFAGLTLPEEGHPIPCRLLIGEMARLGCRFTFLRRSFHRDVRGRDPSELVPRILGAVEDARFRPQDQIAADRGELEDYVAAWPLLLPRQLSVGGRPAR